MRAARWAAIALAAVIGSCGGAPPATKLFERLSPSRTGIFFENTVPDTGAFNIVSYLYYYNGGGVAAGDVNGDGLPDLYFTSNTGEGRLYLNRGGYRFEDVTARAGVAGPPGWKTGVTMADVNGDGRLDIYISAVDHLTMHGHNVLYVNNGDGTFTDRTHEFGLDYAGFGTQAVFFDYDGDGDLDLYLQSHSAHTERAIGSAARGTERNPRTGGRLFRNDGGHFTDVSAQAGIFASSEGFGLGVVASDLDGDGCPDLYVTNDFQENDYLYHNNCDGTFTERIATSTGHTSRFSMGVDAADVNDDGRPDIFSADMMPEREEILKSSASSESFNLFNLRLRAGYHAQYARNALQLNRGGGKFSEIGYLAGVSATDWSWAPLFADLDNDGHKDLFVTSGIYRRPNDLDYINYVGDEAVQATMARGGTKADLEVLQRMPQVAIRNHAYHNDGHLAFTDMAQAWGLGEPGFSNGAVYVDLNNSGALDLVVNTLNGPAAIYRNRAREVNGNSYLTVQLRGAGGNSAGIGARVVIRRGAAMQMLEQMPTRGFLSSVDPRLHFGLGRDSVVDTLTVVWPDHRTQTLLHVAANRILSLSQADATRPAASGAAAGAATASTQPLLTDVTDKLSVPYRHQESAVNDLDREPLMPHLLSTEGPALAVGDVNGDGLDDMYAGGAKWQPGRLLIQQRDGSFIASEQPDIAADSLAEDIDAQFVDVNGDGHLDLVVVNGGNEFTGDAEALRPRLYLNDGRGHFHRAAGGLPAIFVNASCVVAGDFDGDGHPDLFIGGRVVPGKYGVSPRSYLLLNDGQGHFADVTRERAPGLDTAGMISSAAWVDYDGDGKLDLVVAGEWTPVRAFHQEAGRLVERTTSAGLAHSSGWWNSVVAADVNGDGHPDLILGNLGLNSYIKASANEPARMYVGDFAHSGTLEQIITFYKQGVSYPLATRDELVKLMPALRAKYPSYAAFGASRVEDIFPAEELAKARQLRAETMTSAVAINDGHGRFTLRALPIEAQFAPIRSTLLMDIDGDGRLDLLVGGNLFGVPPSLGRYDASYGQLLRGVGAGQFESVELVASGLSLSGQVRHIAALRGAGGRRMIVVARNDDRLQLLQVNAPARSNARGVVLTLK